MKKIVYIVFLILLTGALAVTSGCKEIKSGIDITDGSWAITMEWGGSTISLIYSFRGDVESGSVYYGEEARGMYTVNGDSVNFTVTHYDTDDNAYLYSFRGVFIDYFNMEGEFSINNPDSTIDNGTFAGYR
jgi:hypothetical protein